MCIVFPSAPIILRFPDTDLLLRVARIEGQTPIWLVHKAYTKVAQIVNQEALGQFDWRGGVLEGDPSAR